MEKTDTPKGILDPAAAPGRFSLRHHPPPLELAGHVEFLWTVAWDLGGRPAQVQRILPYPNAHLVFEAGRTALHGVVEGPFDRPLAGQGRVVGLRFRAGGLRALAGVPVARFTGRLATLEEAFGLDTAAAERAVLAGTDDALAAAVAAVLGPLVARTPADPRAALAERAVQAAAAAHGPVTVAALADAVGLSGRGLQRLFHEYVGVTPKWVVQRFRLHEAAASLAAPAQPDLAALAQALGFFDQAHLTRAFTALVGRAPLEYWKSQQGAAAGRTPQ
ncbi:transcriptional regulator, AraC family [Pseudoduganella lurida]|uniref:Transcriptional regulator, AraC family n=1 Tax=Pseudoduganella lurida TaxID=1036180 RepID=A0A562RF60_9BURK|nr:helix-turn-helix domain-containing protein [Pseudoduganella lurida]TWI67681.1 transcriptional regulator, AraC family [Pseudoduganella lurida]